MNRLCYAFLFALCASPGKSESVTPPISQDPELEVELFAQEPMVQQPIGITISESGRVLVIQSNTHFRPKNYQGPEHDRILWLRDLQHQGKADQAVVFFEGTDKTMDIATAPDGAIYVSTRNEILRLHEEATNEQAVRVERKLVHMETTADYPHNGLSGLAFDAHGDLYFSMGENFGLPYRLLGSDGSQHADHGEGGNIFHVTKDGGQLRRVATGFWNPFGVCLDLQGNVFCTDNDPDSRPPCRLNHVIENGDYGYNFRYGRSGLHPFDSWNGELPGTLPMIAGIGEAPCAVKCYTPKETPDFRGLPALWHGRLLVASWADHAIETYELPDHAHAYDGAKKRVLLQGGPDFRPVGIAIDRDGSLYITDWVKRDYELHGSGRVWHVQARHAKPLEANFAQVSGITWKQEQLDKITATKTVSASLAADWLNDPNPWRFSTALHRLAREKELLPLLAKSPLAYPRQRAGVLLAVRYASEASGETPLASPAVFLADEDPTVTLLALKWVADHRLSEFQPQVEKRLLDPSITPAVFFGAITTLARFKSENMEEKDLLKLLKSRITSAATPEALKRTALTILPDRDRNLLVSDVEPLLSTRDEGFREWLAHLLGTLRDQHAQPVLRRLAFDVKQPDMVREAAMDALVIEPGDVQPLLDLLPSAKLPLQRSAVIALEQATLNEGQAKALAEWSHMRGKTTVRPPYPDVPGWRKFLSQVPGKPDLVHGRELFLNPKLGGCIVCHRVDGIGALAGPELSTIGASKAPDYVLESIVQPSRNVAPDYESFLLQTTDGQTRTVFELMERGGTHTYVGFDGKPFEIKIEQIVSRNRLPVSIMPEGLVARFTDEEFRDLVAFLESQK